MSNNDDIINKNFAERLRHALDLRGYPSHGRGRLIYLQEIFNISRSGANKWIHGKALPHRQKRVEIANLLGVNLEWLETGIGLPLEVKKEAFMSQNLVQEIPLLTMKQIYHYKKGTAHTYEESLTVNKTIPANAIAVNFVGDSMAPRFHDGSILIVHIDAPITDGDYVIAKTSILPEAIFRQYIKGSSSNYLLAINPKFETIELETDCTLIGKVIEIRNEL